MEYILSLPSQTKSFLFSLGIGTLLGLSYDLIRIIRLTLTRSRIFLYISDFIFSLLCAVCTFLFCLTQTNGEIRFYIILGEALGFLVYYFSFGIIAVKYTKRTVDSIKSMFRRIFSILFSPIFRLFDFLSKKITIFARKISKKCKTGRFFSRKPLQNDRNVVYNHINSIHNGGLFEITKESDVKNERKRKRKSSEEKT